MERMPCGNTAAELAYNRPHREPSLGQYKREAREEIFDSLNDHGQWPKEGVARLDIASFINDLSLQAGDALINALWADKHDDEGTRLDQRDALRKWIPANLVEELAQRRYDEARDELNRDEAFERDRARFFGECDA